ncbi:hypothetical protein [Nannocystis pusilla]|uniref:hypothetical protein n=1 Tax=Nannocystis pusilla TaxID=889268 RepID=UPI003DA50DA6
MTSDGGCPPELDNIARGVAHEMWALPVDEQMPFLRKHIALVRPKHKFEFTMLVLEKQIQRDKTLSSSSMPPPQTSQLPEHSQPQPGIETTSRLAMTTDSIERRFFIAGCILCVFVAGLVAWAFALGEMTPDQRTLVRVLLSLASGFLVGSFVGGLTIKAHGLVPGIVAVATGGFAVWMLSAFVILRPATAFGVIVQPHGPRGELDTLDSGKVVLQIGGELKHEPISGKGQAHFTGIPSEFEGEEVPVRVDVQRHEMKDPHQKLILQKGHPILVPMVERR